MQNIVTLGEINDALKIAAVTAAQLADMGFAALANKPICEGLPPEESRRLRNAKLYPAESIGQIRVALAQRFAEPATAADVPASGAAALSEYLKTCEQHAIVPDVGGAFASAFAAGLNLAASQAAQPEATAAIKTLQNLGYTYHGAELWKPPIGKVPDFDLIDSLRNRISELEASQAAPAAVAVPDERSTRQIADAITNNFQEAGWSMPSIDKARVLEAVTAAIRAHGTTEPLTVLAHDVDSMARVLLAAFSKAEPEHPITQYPTSFWATFADMARAALAAIPEAAPVDKSPEVQGSVVDKAANLQGSAAVAVPDELRTTLIDVIAQGLSGTWHCNRVWEAWHVGTMSQEDFSPVEESDTPTELADAVLAALAATPANCDSLEQLNGNNDLPSAAPVVLPEPDDAYTRRIIEALNENGDPVSVDAAEEMERLRALLVGVSAPADKLRVDALLHFMQANCFNNELNADESCNILFNIDQLREWRSGKHDNYVEKLYGRLHSMGGCEQGQGASAGHSGDASASAGDGLSVAAPQAQADARDADGKAFRTAARLGLTLRFYGNCAQSGAPGTPSVYEVTTGPDSAEAMRASIDRAAIAAAKGE